ncbi:protein LAZ1 homolog 2-like [Chenopodium quinoa]|uniref:protein LAZ1 homolog 2-like n=1 Tax=Chenopodium quinoa TaxID=63459 RepID=UPI000B78EBC0|nr:protein LAZ1 homolog 2-like [Chenopodium quinoa]
MTEYKEIRRPAIITAGFFALLASLLSIVLILQHLRAYNNPAVDSSPVPYFFDAIICVIFALLEQKWVVAMLLIVPIYATESIISLSNPKTSLACDILRNCYEAYALYTFGSYLISCLGGEERVLELLKNESRNVLNKPLLEGGDAEPELSHPSSFRNFFLRPTELGEQLFSIIKFGLVQYVSISAVSENCAKVIVKLTSA